MAEKVFYPGQIVWTLEYEDNIPVDYSGSIVLCQINEIVISSPKVNGLDDVEFLLKYYAQMNREWDGVDLYVNDLCDCFQTREEVSVELERRVKGN